MHFLLELIILIKVHILFMYLFACMYMFCRVLDRKQMYVTYLYINMYITVTVRCKELS